MKLKLPNRRRALRWFGILAAIAILVLYIVMPAVFAIVVVFPYKESVGAPPAGFTEIELAAEDGVTLKAWYAPATNGAAIILLHGAGGSREGVRDHAAMLVENGYGVLALDMRGHGESGGTTNRFGWQGTRDVGAAVAFLRERETSNLIGALGLSLGGEVLLGAASAHPEIRAIVADGATQRSVAELRALDSERPLYRNFTARVMYATVQLLTGQDPPKPLLDSMREAESTAFLLVAAGQDEMEVRFNEMFAATLGERATLWVAPDVGHTRAFNRYPEEYEQRVIAFFDAALTGPATEPAP